jgi:MoxR-like ATPase
MTAKPKSDNKVTLTLSPAECAQAILGMARAVKKRAIFLWGQPGISKSAISKQVANELGVAFIDIRLSQMDPTDLRGIPYPTKIGNMQGIAWSAPLVLPRDLDYEDVIEIEAIDTVVRFYNPKGDNGIHYCTDPVIAVKALNPEHTAVLLSSDADRAAVVIHDADGNPVAGKFQMRVTGVAKALVGLEEFNSAPPSVQAAAYQLILDRRLGEYIVPDACYLMAMGNRDTDKGVTFKMPTPIMNRFVHIEMHVDIDGWLDWAVGAQVHPHVVGFIGAFNEELNNFDPGSAARGFETPRSWEFASDILYSNEDSVSDQVLTGLLVGAVGDAGGVKFMEFRRIAADLPKAEEILSGRLKKLDKKTDVSLAYALTTTLCYRLLDEVNDMKRVSMGRGISLRQHPDFNEWTQRCDIFLGFIMSEFKPEIAIMGGKAALATHKLPFDTQRMTNFQVFADQYKKFIL